MSYMIKSLRQANVQKTVDQIKELFNSEEFKGRVPHKEIKAMLNSKSWRRFAGGNGNLVSAWKEFCNPESGFVRRGVKNWNLVHSRTGNELKEKKYEKVKNYDKNLGKILKMRGEDKVKNLIGFFTRGKGEISIDKKNLSVKGISPRDQHLIQLHLTKGTGFRKKNVTFESINELNQTISGNKMFMKRTILPITKKAGIKKVKIKELPAQYDDDKDKIEISFDVDKETNDSFLDLLKKKAGKKGTKKRKNFNLTVQKEAKGKMNLSLLKIQTKNLATDVQDLFKAVKDGDEGEITDELNQVKFRIDMLRKKGMGLKEGLGDNILKNLKKYKKAAEKNQAALDAARKRLKKKESVDEVRSKTITAIGSIIGKKQAKKIGGVLVDMQTANVIMKVWNALNKSNRSKFEKLPIKKMATVAWKLMK